MAAQQDHIQSRTLLKKTPFMMICPFLTGIIVAPALGDFFGGTQSAYAMLFFVMAWIFFSKPCEQVHRHAI
jgi:hypothetical protein